MTVRIDGRGRWVVVLGLAAGLVAGAEVFSADGPGSSARLVAQKSGKKKAPGGPARKGTADAPEDAMKKAGGEAMPKAKAAEAGAPATDDGSMSFAKDIAPILAANCVGCHSGNGNGKTRGKLDMSTFAKLMAGGKRGEDIIGGDPEGSHLVLMITGEETPKMPQGNQASISDDAKSKITAWVQQGAKLDAGVDPNALLKDYAASAADLRRSEVAKMAPDRRDALTKENGLARWKKVSKVEPEVTTGQHFILFGEMPKGRLENVLKAMEARLTLANQLLAPSRDKAVGAGEKVSLYVFKDRNTFVEFVRTAENQDVEADEQARAKLDIESPYVVALDPAGGGEESSAAPAKKSSRTSRGKRAAASDPSSGGGGGATRSLAGIMTEALVPAIATRAGKPPRWVSLGLGTYLASGIEGGSPYYRSLRAQVAENFQIGWIPRCNEVLGGQAPNETIRAVGFGLFEWISANAPPATQAAFVRAMLEGPDKLDEAIETTLNIPNREAFLQMSGAWIATNYGGGR